MKKWFIAIMLFTFYMFSYAGPNNEVVLGYAAGGPSDVLARILLDTDLNENYYLTYKPGAGGAIGMSYVQEKNVAGLNIAENVFVSNPLIYGDKLIYDEKNINVLGVITANPAVLVCRSDLNFFTANDIAKYKGNLNFAVAGKGGIEELTTKIFFKKINKEHQIINYAVGGNKQFIDLLGGHVDCAFGNLPSVLPQLNNNRITPIMSTLDISKTVKGIPNWNEVYGEKFPIQLTMVLVAPKTMPIEMQEKIAKDFKRAYETEGVYNKLIQKGYIPIGLFGKQAEEYNTKNIKRFKETLSTYNLSVN